MSQNPVKSPERKQIVNTEDQHRATNPAGTSRDNITIPDQQPAADDTDPQPVFETPNEGDESADPGHVEGDDIGSGDRSPDL